MGKKSKVKSEHGEKVIYKQCLPDDSSEDDLSDDEPYRKTRKTKPSPVIMETSPVKEETDDAQSCVKEEEIFEPAETVLSSIKNRIRRQVVYGRMKNERKKAKRDLKKLKAKEEEISGVKEKKKVPDTIESKREIEETFVMSESDEDLLINESRDTYSNYYTKKYEPKVLITASDLIHGPGKMEWSQEKTCDFIKEYTNLPILWDIRLSEYKNKYLKLAALMELAIKFECDIYCIKKKIKNLRTSFQREHKLLTMKQSGSLCKRAKWFGYDSLTFLLDVPTSRRRLATDANIKDAEESEDEYPEASPVNTQSTVSNPEASLVNIQSAASNSESSPVSTQFAVSNKNLKQIDSNCVVKKAVNNKKKRKLLSIENERPEEAYKISKASPNRDECSVYGEHLANELRRFSQKAQAVVKHIINNTLFDAAMGKFDDVDQRRSLGRCSSTDLNPTYPSHSQTCNPSALSYRYINSSTTATDSSTSATPIH